MTSLVDNGQTKNFFHLKGVLSNFFSEKQESDKARSKKERETEREIGFIYNLCFSFNILKVFFK